VEYSPERSRSFVFWVPLLGFVSLMALGVYLSIQGFMQQSQNAIDQESMTKFQWAVIIGLYCLVGVFFLWDRYQSFQTSLRYDKLVALLGVSKSDALLNPESLTSTSDLPLMPNLASNGLRQDDLGQAAINLKLRIEALESQNQILTQNLRAQTQHYEVRWQGLNGCFDQIILPSWRAINTKNPWEIAQGELKSLRPVRVFDSFGRVLADQKGLVDEIGEYLTELMVKLNSVGRSDQSHKAQSILQDAVNQVQSTSTLLGDLVEGAQAIGPVVSLIATIAQQTNLLALNATIEAARAGSHGAGFSVVASEVKALSFQTEKATHEISSRVKKIQADTFRATTAITEVAGSLVALGQAQSKLTAIGADFDLAKGDRLMIRLKDAMSHGVNLIAQFESEAGGLIDVNSVMPTFESSKEQWDSIQKAHDSALHQAQILLKKGTETVGDRRN